VPLAGLRFGLWVLVFWLFVGFVGFLFCFFLLARVWFSLFTCCLLRGPLRFFNIFLGLHKKKKKKKKMAITYKKKKKRKTIYVLQH